MRVFIAIGQTPFDPTSGAATATLHLAELLVLQGNEVRVLSTTGTEGPHVGELPSGSLVERGVYYRILAVPFEQRHSWHHLMGQKYDTFFDETIRSWEPDALFTFGDEAPDVSRRKRAKDAGVRVIFCLHNARYRNRLPSHVDVFLTPSWFLEQHYREVWKDRASLVTLPTPIIPERVIASQHDPVFVTFINPQPAKGLCFMIRFAEQLGRHHPEIPLRVIEGRASAADFIGVARSMGIRLEQFSNLFFSPSVADCREIWGISRVVLVPSVWDEPAGRVVPEAMLNGVIPITSGRGGLSEQLGRSGRNIPLPTWLTPESRKIPSSEDVRPWLKQVETWCFEDAAYEEEAQRAREEAQRFLPSHVGEKYQSLLNSP